MFRCLKVTYDISRANGRKRRTDHEDGLGKCVDKNHHEQLKNRRPACEIILSRGVKHRYVSNMNKL